MNVSVISWKVGFFLFHYYNLLFSVYIYTYTIMKEGLFIKFIHREMVMKSWTYIDIFIFIVIRSDT